MARRMALPAALVLCLGGVAAARPAAAPEVKLDALKVEAAAEVERTRDETARMVATIFSFAELGFQEFETTRYCLEILRRSGFRVEEGIAGIPTAWIATWGSGRPVIAI